jgi:hypothetical protein
MLKMTDKEKKIMIPLLEKLMNERCIDCDNGYGICTDNSTDKTCPFYHSFARRLLPLR